ncbi:MAG: universal stress protein [Betaproteobacteria bacterium]|nr:MAG: universal stress protein [Betaproteobacteria bacterium]
MSRIAACASLAQPCTRAPGTLPSSVISRSRTSGESSTRNTCMGCSVPPPREPPYRRWLKTPSESAASGVGRFLTRVRMRPMDRVPLLVPFDGSPAALRAVELLAGYRGAVSLAPTALNVQARPVTIWPESVLDASEVEAALLEAGAEELRPALARLAGARGAVRLGFPADSIVREAASLGVRAIVMGTRGKGALHGFPLGSVALRVAHAAAVPTLLVKPEARLPARFGAGLKLIVGMDGSEPALRALAQVVAWRELSRGIQISPVVVIENSPPWLKARGCSRVFLKH